MGFVHIQIDLVLIITLSPRRIALKTLDKDIKLAKKRLILYWMVNFKQKTHSRYSFSIITIIFSIFRDDEFVWHIFVGWARKHWRNKTRVHQSSSSLGEIPIDKRTIKPFCLLGRGKRGNFSSKPVYTYQEKLFFRKMLSILKRLIHTPEGFFVKSSWQKFTNWLWCLA
jgi:hypothetical protein